MPQVSELAVEQLRRILAETFATARDVWSPWAASHGLRLDPGNPSLEQMRLPFIEGWVDGIGVRIELEMGMLDPTQRTRFVARPRSPFPGHAALTRGELSVLGKLFGAQDIVVGDAPFDRAYVIKSTNEPSLRAWLTPAARAAMLALDVVTLRYDDGSGHGGKPSVTLDFETQAASTRTLDALLNLLLRVATARPDASGYR